MENTTTKDKAPHMRVKYAGVVASVWREARTGRDGKSWNSWSVQLERSYMDPKTGEWRNTHSLKDSDIPKALAALGDTYKYIMQQGDATHDNNK
jgi:hypothetical protein